VNGNTRQRNLLIVLGVLLLIVGWMYLRPLLGLGGDDEVLVPAAQRPSAGIDDEDGGPVARRPASGEEHHGARPGDRVSVLRVADLDRVPPVLTAGRDPWRYVEPPPPPAPKPPPPPSAEELRRMEEERRRAEEAARLAAAEAARIAAIPRPPEFTMEYLGYFGPPDKKIAVFSNGKTTVNKLEGGVIDNKFIVARIGYESVDIRFVGFPDAPAKRLGVRRR
jgi:hypothetical protein